MLPLGARVGFFKEGEGGRAGCHTMQYPRYFTYSHSHVDTIDRKYLIQKTFSTK